MILPASLLGELDSALQTSVSEFAEQLLAGKRLFVRSLPNLGGSMLLQRLAVELGGLELQSQGKTWPSNEDGSASDGLLERLREKAVSDSFVALLFDDYDRALQQEGGAKLDHALQAALTNSPTGTAVGALFTAKATSRVTPRSRGSTLMLEFQEVMSPRVPAHIAAEHPSLRTLLGDSLLVWIRATRSAAAGAGNFHSWALAELGGWQRDIPEAALALLESGDLTQDLVDRNNWHVCLDPLWADGAPTGLYAFLATEGLTSKASIYWPSDSANSVARFSHLAGSAGHACWIDRYLGERPMELRKFLRAFRKQSQVHLQVITSVRRTLPASERRVLEGMSNEITGITLRFMDYRMYRELHDRQLILDDGTGWTLPTGSVILGSEDPGSALPGRIAHVPRGHSNYWSNATPAPVWERND
ncbi:hypothetical protein ACVWW9_000904 [Agrococcus sp. UYP33]